jgi:hypothetical protein
MRAPGDFIDITVSKLGCAPGDITVSEVGCPGSLGDITVSRVAWPSRRESDEIPVEL